MVHLSINGLQATDGFQAGSEDDILKKLFGIRRGHEIHSNQRERNPSKKGQFFNELNGNENVEVQQERD
jgi:hypothetical protein